MPFYEYQCKNCGHDLEAMQKISDPPLKKCPHCGKSQLQRLMSAPVFRLKGGGWYETDFKGDQDNKRNLADRPEADAPTEGTKDGGKDGGKDAGADGKAKEANGKEAKTADAAGAKDASSKDKPADKSGDSASKSANKSPGKPPAESVKKAGSGGKSSVRPHTAGRGKSAAKRPIKRPVHKAKRRG